MKRIIITCITALGIVISFASCEKVIDVSLTAAEVKYVIEGTVSNIASQPPTVLLSQTKKFEDNNVFTGISGAIVTIQVNNDTIYSLTEVSTGVYKTEAFIGVPGGRYTLSVSINGSTYTSISVMPAQLVSLDALTVDDLAFGGSNTKTIAPDYLDPVGLGNSYRFIQYANGIQVKKVIVQNDDLSDGLRITRPLVNTDGDLKTGDFVKVDMLCIDPQVYRYWYSLDQAATGANQSATPANPVSNINGGAIGYFSAHSISSHTIVIP
jgi:Domain of unknown function (DUF4249)